MSQPTSGRAAAGQVRRFASSPHRRLVVSGVVLAIFLCYTWLVVHWQPFSWLDDTLNRKYHVRVLWPLITTLDRIGQRAVCLTILAVVVGATAVRHRSWRPVVVAAVGVFTVNLLVLIAKLAMARGAPTSGESFFATGDLYPSGHAANVLTVYGLYYHLITHYWDVSASVQLRLAAAVAVLADIMFTTSLVMRWHWFSDLIGGFMVGGAIFAAVTAVDAATPFRSARLVVLPNRAPALEADERIPVPVDAGSIRETPSGSRAPVAARRSRR